MWSNIIVGDFIILYSRPTRTEDKLSIDVYTEANDITNTFTIIIKIIHHQIYHSGIFCGQTGGQSGMGKMVSAQYLKKYSIVTKFDTQNTRARRRSRSNLVILTLFYR